MVNGGYSALGTALRDAAFQVASIATTTGFATQDTTLWPPLSMATLILCSAQGSGNDRSPTDS